MNNLITRRMIQREFVYQQMKFKEGPWEAKRCIFDMVKQKGFIGNQEFPLSDLSLSLNEFSTKLGWLKPKAPWPFMVQ